jgi:ABC-type transport system involved in cytochrome bd biosynthesis fused ATPase/permease subunit
MILKIPTAWLQLKYEKLRLLVAIGGISFAVVLIFTQLGLRAALFDSAVALHTSLQGEIFLLSPRSTSLVAMEIKSGEIVIMTGQSGSGKTTLLSLMGGLRSVQTGSLRVLGQELNGANENQLVRYC